MGFFQLSEVQKKAPQALTPRCGACGLFKTCDSPKMLPYGQGGLRAVVVGEAPGAEEDKEDRPFVGASGKFLRSTLSRLGYDLDKDAVTTNALICRPPGNEAPSTEQIGHCYPNLRATLEKEQPIVVITLGLAALQSVLTPYWTTDVGTMERWAGWRIPMDKHWICPTWHPSFLMRRQDKMLDRLFEQHLLAAFELREYPPQRREPEIELFYETSEIQHLLGEFDSAGGWAAFDYETNCLKPEYEQAQIWSCAISNGDRTCAFPFFSEIRPALGQFLKSPRTKKIASNLKFEERWTRNTFGHGVESWGWDTMLAAHCLDNRRGICSLKFQSFVRLGVESYNENVDPYLSSGDNHYNRIHEIGTKTLLTYNAMDAFLEYELAMVQMKDMGL